jgi:hypothetical protein
VVVCFGKFFWKLRTNAAHIFGLLFPTVKVKHYFLPNMDWATFLGYFFTNSSGHPGHEFPQLFRRSMIVQILHRLEIRVGSGLSPSPKIGLGLFTKKDPKADPDGHENLAKTNGPEN